MDFVDFKKLRDRVMRKMDNHSKMENCCFCWIWTGGMRTDGRYGQLKVAGRVVNAHRASYMAFKEYIDLPLDISHICHNRLCVNPHHLSHEEHDVNIDREGCRAAGRCTSHRSQQGTLYKPCVFKQCKQWR